MVGVGGDGRGRVAVTAKVNRAQGSKDIARMGRRYSFRIA